jgi:peptidyl-prolyl cis-trans isomerase B (cyclophilin B)
MARRERERYTERSRPHRKEPPRSAGKGQAKSDPSPWRNPIVLMAAAGLVLAVVLAVGFILGRDRGPTTTADAPAAAPTAEVEGDAVEAAPTLEAGATEAPPAAGDTGDEPAEAAGLSLPGEGSPYAQPDDMGLDGAAKAYFVTIETDKGPIRAELWPEAAPAHVNSFVFLAREGFFDGLTFHRVEDWVVQGGDPTGTGSGGPGYNVPAEFNADNPLNHRFGTLAMARSSDPNSGGSQFYFIKSPDGASYLDGQYTVFGHVIEGMDVVQALAMGDTMTTVTIEEKDKSESVVSPDQIRAGDLPEAPSGTTE